MINENTNTKEENPAVSHLEEATVLATNGNKEVAVANVTHQKSAYSIDYILQMARVATPIFDHAHTIFFQSTLNFYESASICKNQFKNTGIWLVKSILAHISETRIFPGMQFVQV